jgi:hypothetical protein
MLSSYWMHLRYDAVIYAAQVEEAEATSHMVEDLFATIAVRSLPTLIRGGQAVIMDANVNGTGI